LIHTSLTDTALELTCRYETTQTDQHNSDAQAINIPTVSTKKRERSTQTRCTYTGSLPKPTKFDPDDPALIDRFPEYSPDIDMRG
jgi:hypothetical protein